MPCTSSSAAKDSQHQHATTVLHTLYGSSNRPCINPHALAACASNMGATFPHVVGSNPGIQVFIEPSTSCGSTAMSANTFGASAHKLVGNMKLHLHPDCFQGAMEAF